MVVPVHLSSPLSLPYITYTSHITSSKLKFCLFFYFHHFIICTLNTLGKNFLFTSIHSSCLIFINMIKFGYYTTEIHFIIFTIYVSFQNPHHHLHDILRLLLHKHLHLIVMFLAFAFINAMYFHFISPLVSPAPYMVIAKWISCLLSAYLTLHQCNVLQLHLSSHFSCSIQIIAIDLLTSLSLLDITYTSYSLHIQK